MTVKLVAAEIGYTDAAVYHHFPTKDHLLVGVLRFRDEKAPEPALKKLPDIFIAAAESNEHEPQIVELIVDFGARAADRSHPAHDYFMERYVSVSSWLRAYLRDVGVEESAVENAADLWIAASDGLLARWLVDRDLDMVSRMRDISKLLPGGTGQD